MSHQRFTYDTYYSYFQDIATKHKEIKGFVKQDVQDAVQYLQQAEKRPAMIISSFKENLSSHQADNDLSLKQISFGIVDHYSSKAKNPRTKQQIIGDCRVLAIDVITYLRREKRANRLPGFRIDVISEGMAIVNEMDEFYGWEYQISIYSTEDLSFDESKWNL